MSIILEPVGDDAFSSENAGAMYPTDQPHLEEVWSEDGIFCPHCGKRQSINGPLVNNLNQCESCLYLYWYRKEVHVSYVTSATMPRHCYPASDAKLGVRKNPQSKGPT